MTRPTTDRSRQLLLTLAFGTAASVATLYLCQPLLPLLSQELHATPKTVGLLVTVTQLGYALGIFFLVPLGDVLNKRKLIAAKLAALFLSLAAAGLAPSITALLAAHAAIGIFSTAAQDFVPLAADLAAPEKRGRVIGTVMSGLLLGILVSRTFSGLIADHFGWRAVFFTAGALIAGVAGLVAVLVPSREGKAQTSYLALMRSTLRLPVTYPLLGLASLTQGMLGLVFSAFWTVLSFHLAGDAFRLSTSQIGYFGLAGAAGAFAAPLAGKLADRRGPFFNIPIAIAITFSAFVWMTLLPTALLSIIAGAVFFDMGVQMSAVSHQSIIYSLDPGARSRINAIFVSVLFVFFAIGSATGNALFVRFGWPGLTSLCLVSCAIAYGVHRLAAFRARTTAQPRPALVRTT
ncbi:MFS transporter [Opitutaceae bacterium EW11]|nr:MFS transporter [Opitutaceae bacterium EW11]